MYIYTNSAQPFLDKMATTKFGEYRLQVATVSGNTIRGAHFNRLSCLSVPISKKPDKLM